MARSRKDPGCDPKAWGLSGSQPPPSRPDPPCDPPKTVPQPEFDPPPPVDPADLTLLSPTPITVSSVARTVTCAEHFPYPDEAYDGTSIDPGYPAPVGPNVTVPAGLETALFSFQGFGLTAGKLDFIARKQLEDPAAVAAAIAGTAQDVRNLLRVGSATAAEMVAVRANLQDDVDEAALSIAVSRLVCVWTSAEQNVDCEDLLGAPGAGAVVSNASPYNNPVSVAAGYETSPNSQTEADELARTYALSLLSCLFASAEVTVTCEEGPVPGGASGNCFSSYGATIPEWTPASPGPDCEGEPVVNKVVLEAGHVGNAATQEEADALALATANSLLHCCIPNPAMRVTCDEVVYSGADPEDPFVSVAAGVHSSETSCTDVLDEAIAIARGALDCTVCTPEITVRCSDVEAIPDEGVDHYSQLVGEVVTTVLNEGKSDPFEVTFAECYYRVPAGSPTEEIEAQIRQEGVAMLGCVYCAPGGPPRCAATSSDPATGGSSNSLDRTLGAAADVHCSTSPLAAVLLMDSLGLSPDPPTEGGEPVCTYGNEPLEADCDVIASRVGAPAPYNKWNEESVFIARNSFFAASLSAANGLAVEVAQSILQCRYVSVQSACCPTGEIFEPTFRGDDRPQDIFGRLHLPESPLWKIRSNAIVESDLPPGELTEADYVILINKAAEDTGLYALSEETPCEVGRGESYNDPGEAYIIAKAEAVSKLKCPFTNWERITPENLCPPGMRHNDYDDVIVSAGVFVSENGSTEEADIMAEEATKVSVVCFNDHGGRIIIGSSRSASSGFQIDGKVSGGSAQVGKLCAFEPDCVPQPGDIIEFEELEIDDLPEGDVYFFLKIECKDGELKAEVFQHDKPDPPDDEFLYIPIGSVKEGLIHQDAMGLIQVEGGCEERHTCQGFGVARVFWNPAKKKAYADVCLGEMVDRTGTGLSSFALEIEGKTLIDGRYLELEVGLNFLTLKWETTKDGRITAAKVVMAPAAAVTEYLPDEPRDDDSPAAGVEGDYSLPLYEITVTDQGEIDVDHINDVPFWDPGNLALNHKPSVSGSLAKVLHKWDGMNRRLLYRPIEGNLGAEPLASGNKFSVDVFAGYGAGGLTVKPTVWALKKTLKIYCNSASSTEPVISFDFLAPYDPDDTEETIEYDLCDCDCMSGTGT